MTFKNYVLEATYTKRSISINVEDVINQLRHNCKEYLNYLKVHPARQFYRGFPAGRETYLYINPGNSIRNPRGANSMYYLAFFPIVPAWNTFPPRRSSIAFSTSYKRSQFFGYLQTRNTIYNVYPFDNANFGITSTEDFNFLSRKFDNAVHPLGNGSFKLGEIALFLCSVCTLGHISSIDIDQPFTIDWIKKVNEKFDLDHNLLLTIVAKADPTYNEQLSQQFYHDYKGNLLGVIQKWLDPSAYGVMAAKGINEVWEKVPLHSRGRLGKEVWTNSPAILISTNDDNPEIRNLLNSDWWKK